MKKSIKENLQDTVCQIAESIETNYQPEFLDILISQLSKQQLISVINLSKQYIPIHCKDIIDRSITNDLL